MTTARIGVGSSVQRSRRVHTEGCAFEALEGRQMLSTTGPDDRFENNDLPRQVVQRVEAATNSPSLGTIQGQRIIRQLALVDSADYFRFRTAATSTSANFVRLNFGNANGNLDLKLIGASGKTVLRQSIGNTGTETINLNGLAAGIYFVKVEGKGGQTNAVYRLTFQLPTAPPPPPPPPADDAYEDNDTREQVALRAPGVNSPHLGNFSARTVTGLILNDTYDIYRFTALSSFGSSAFIRINSTASLDMVLFNSANQPVRSSEAYLGQNTINLSGLLNDNYYLQVTHYALGTEGPFNYTLTFGA